VAEVSSGQEWFANRRLEEERAEEQRWQAYLELHTTELVRAVSAGAVAHHRLRTRLREEFTAAERVRKELLSRAAPDGTISRSEAEAILLNAVQPQTGAGAKRVLDEFARRLEARTRKDEP
jgi:hypothetical protein